MKMSTDKHIVRVKEKEFGGDSPLICVPLVGKTSTEIITELKKIMVKDPDVIEWRADHFLQLNDTEKVIDILHEIRNESKELPIIFTIRSTKEGGEEIALTESEKIELLNTVCQSGLIDIFDYELVNEKDDIKRLKEVSVQNNVKLILSYHNFENTPDVDVIVNKCIEMEEMGANIAKIAVMPTNMEDVLKLLQATEIANQKIQTPLITISMGSYGAITRMAGWLFGSSLTFAIGEQSSAPGQVPIEDLREILRLMKKSF